MNAVSGGYFRMRGDSTGVESTGVRIDDALFVADPIVQSEQRSLVGEPKN